MITVIKKNGMEEPFDEEKLRDSIIAAADDAGFNEDRTKEVVNNIAQKVFDNISGEKKVTTYKIREIVLRELGNVEDGIAAAWREYEMSK